MSELGHSACLAPLSPPGRPTKNVQKTQKEKWRRFSEPPEPTCRASCPLNSMHAWAVVVRTHAASSIRNCGRCNFGRRATGGGGVWKHRSVRGGKEKKGARIWSSGEGMKEEEEEEEGGRTSASPILESRMDPSPAPRVCPQTIQRGSRLVLPQSGAHVSVAVSFQVSVG